MTDHREEVALGDPRRHRLVALVDDFRLVRHHRALQRPEDDEQIEQHGGAAEARQGKDEEDRRIGDAVALGIENLHHPGDRRLDMPDGEGLDLIEPPPLGAENIAFAAHQRRRQPEQTGNRDFECERGPGGARLPDLHQRFGHRSGVESPPRRRLERIDAEFGAEPGQVGVAPVVRIAGAGRHMLDHTRNDDGAEFGQQLDKGVARPLPVRRHAIRHKRQPGEFHFQVHRRVVEMVEGDQVAAPVGLRPHRQEHDSGRDGEGREQHQRRDPKSSPQIVACQNPVHHGKPRPVPSNRARAK